MDDTLYSEIAKNFEKTYDTQTSQMFGKPCLKVNGKAFAAFFKGEMVFKLGQEEVNLLLNQYDGSVKWDPSSKNRAMKDWIQIPAIYNQDWSKLAKEAMYFVQNL